MRISKDVKKTLTTLSLNYSPRNEQNLKPYAVKWKHLEASKMLLNLGTLHLLYLARNLTKQKTSNGSKNILNILISQNILTNISKSFFTNKRRKGVKRSKAKKATKFKV